MKTAMTGKKKTGIRTFGQKKHKKHKHPKTPSNMPSTSGITITEHVRENENMPSNCNDSETESLVHDDNMMRTKSAFVLNDVPTDELKNLFKVADVSNCDDSLDSPPSQNGSTSSLSMVTMTSSNENSLTASQVCSGEDDSTQLLDISSVTSSSSGRKLFSNCLGGTAANLSSIRDQIATSLPMIRELEKQAKAVPLLQVKLSKLKEEKKTLLLQLRVKAANRRSVGVGDLTLYDSASANKKFRRKALAADKIVKAYLPQADQSTSSQKSIVSASLEEGLSSPMIALRLNAELEKRGLNFHQAEYSEHKHVSSRVDSHKQRLQNIPSYSFSDKHQVQFTSSEFLPLENLLTSQNGISPSNSPLVESSNSDKFPWVNIHASCKPSSDSNNAKMKKLTFHICETTSYSPCLVACCTCQGKLSKVSRDFAVQASSDENSGMCSKDLKYLKCVECAVNTDPVMIYREDKALLAAKALKLGKLSFDKSKFQVCRREDYASMTPKSLLKMNTECWTNNALCTKCREQKMFKDAYVQTDQHPFLCGKCNTEVDRKSVGIGNYSIFDDVEYRQSVTFKDAQVGSNEPLCLDINISKSKSKDKITGFNLCDKCYSLAIGNLHLNSTSKLNMKRALKTVERMQLPSPKFILNSNPGQYSVSHQDENISDHHQITPRPVEKVFHVRTGCGPFENCTFSGSRPIGSNSELDTSDSRDSESSDSPEEGSYDGVLGCIVNKCVDDEAILQGLPGARMFNPLHTHPRQRIALNNNFLSACMKLGQYMQNPSQAIDMQNVLTVIQKEWFGLVTQYPVDPHVIQDYLDAFEQISIPLLEAIVNLADGHGNTALHFALSHNNFEVVSLLIDTKVCNVQMKNRAGYTPIMLVCLIKIENEMQSETIWKLLQLGDLNTKASQNGQTALMLAVSRGQLEVVRLLLEAGADVNIQDDDGSTALMCAAEHGYITISQLLLAHPNCDPYITDNDGSNACTIALEAGHMDVGLVIYFSMTACANSPYSSLRYNRLANKSTSSSVSSSCHSPPLNKLT